MPNFNFAAGEEDPMTMAIRLSELGMNQRLMRERIAAYQRESQAALITAEMKAIKTNIDLLRVLPPGKMKAAHLRGVLGHPIFKLDPNEIESAVLDVETTSDLLVNAQDQLLKDPSPETTVRMLDAVVGAVRTAAVDPEQGRAIEGLVNNIAGRYGQAAVAPSLGMSPEVGFLANPETMRARTSLTTTGMVQGAENAREIARLGQRESEFTRTQAQDWTKFQATYNQDEAQFLTDYARQELGRYDEGASKEGDSALQVWISSGPYKTDAEGNIIPDPSKPGGANADLTPDMRTQLRLEAQAQYYFRVADSLPQGHVLKPILYDRGMVAAQQGAGSRQYYEEMTEGRQLTDAQRARARGEGNVIDNTKEGGIPTEQRGGLTAIEAIGAAKRTRPQTYSQLVLNYQEGGRTILESLPPKISVGEALSATEIAKKNLLPLLDEYEVLQRADRSPIGSEMEKAAIISHIDQRLSDQQGRLAVTDPNLPVESRGAAGAVELGKLYARLHSEATADYGTEFTRGMPGARGLWSGDPQADEWSDPTWEFFMNEIMPVLGLATDAVPTPNGKTVLVPRDPILAVGLLMARFNPSKFANIEDGEGETSAPAE